MTTHDDVWSAHETYWWRLVALTTRHAGSSALAEDAVSAAFEQALKTWPRDGVPESRFAWLATAAKNKTIDAIRQHERRKQREADDALVRTWVDERGRVSLDDEIHMMALAAHPKLSITSATCVVLRNLSGISTEALAALHAVPTATMAARLTRAKKTLDQHRHELFDLESEDLRPRVPVLRHTLYAAWGLAHTQVVGDTLRDAETAKATLRLMRRLSEWDSHDETQSLAALGEFSTARWSTRQPGGNPTAAQNTLEHADRRQWNWKLIVQATARLQPATSTSGLYRWRAEVERLLTCRTWAETDWPKVVSAYEHALRAQPEPTTALARSVALSYAFGPCRGLQDLDELLTVPQAKPLLDYPYTYAAKAEMYARQNQWACAQSHWIQAADYARTDAERHYFRQRAQENRR